MMALMAEKTGTEPEGITKLEPSLRSMIEAWLRKNVESCAKEMERAIVDAHMGNTLRKHLNSSTCVTVHNFHLFVALNASGSDITAALSKNLQAKVNQTLFYCYVNTTSSLFLTDKTHTGYRRFGPGINYCALETNLYCEE